MKFHVGKIVFNLSMTTRWPATSCDCLLFYPVHRVLVEMQIELEAVVRPGSEFHLADLAVKREVEDVYRASGFEDGRRHPHDLTIVLYDSHCFSMFC
jgi:hypothetical protein